MRHRDEELLCCDATVYNKDGQILASVVGLTARRVGSSNSDGTAEHEVTLEAESTQKQTERVSMDFTNVLVLNPPSQSEFNCFVFVKKAFPDAAVHERALDTTDKQWAGMDMRFALD